MTHDGGTGDEPERSSKLVATTRDQPREVGRALILGALGSVPVVGPVLGELASTFYPDVKIERLQRAAAELSDAVVHVQSQIDEAFVRQAGFGVLFEEYLDRVTRARNDAKLGYFAAALAHSMVDDRPEARALQRLMDVLDQVHPSHLQLLAALYRGAPSPPAAPPYSVGAAAYAALGAAAAELGPDALQDLGDLQRLGLVHDLADTSVLMHVASDVRRVITPFGREFVRFVSAGMPGGTASPTG